MDTIININDVFFNYYFLIGGLFLSYLIYRIFHSLFDDNNYMRTQYRARGHAWRSIQCNTSIPYNIHCTNCGKLMLPAVGLFCECCAVSACKRCHRLIDKKLRCKPISWLRDKPFYHHWVNVGTTQSESNDQNEDGLIKYFCCWCQRTKALRSSPFNDTQECDFQKYRNIIIPPVCVQLHKGDIPTITSPSNDDWEPLIVLANPKSGSNRSDEVLSIFRGLLNPIQVVDISVTRPEKVVQWLPSKCRLMVAGGDGTVAWILNSLIAVPHVKAAVSILPTGTGNDLSRVLGWGTGCTSNLDAHSIISAIGQATLQPLDRIHQIKSERQSNLKYIISLEDRLDKYETSVRATCVEIRNIPTQQKETKESLLDIIITIGNYINVPIQLQEIRDVFRINSKDKDNKPIILDFTSILKKDKFIQMYKKHNKNNAKLTTDCIKMKGPSKPIFISENLSAKLKRLFFLSRDFAKVNEFRYCWTSHGKIFLRKFDGSPLFLIKCENDLKIINGG